jgi:hypothetical protein
VNDAQTWTLITGFFALMVTMVGMTLRVVKSEITVLGAQLGSRIDTIEVRFDGLERKIDHMDRDVQMVVTRLMEN